MSEMEKLYYTVMVSGKPVSGRFVSVALAEMVVAELSVADRQLADIIVVNGTGKQLLNE